MVTSRVILIALLILVLINWIGTGFIFQDNAVDNLAGYYQAVLIYPIQDVFDGEGSYLLDSLNAVFSTALAPIRIIIPIFNPSATNAFGDYVDNYDKWKSDQNVTIVDRFSVINNKFLDLIKRAVEDSQ